MTEVELRRYRLEPGKKERLLEWAEEVTSRRDEAIDTLEDERMFTEAAFLESSADGEYVSFFMEAEDLEEAYETFEDSTHDIDHRRRVCAGTHRRRTTNTLDESVGR